MGCIDSTISTVELYSLLNQITKQSFLNAISEDDLAAIANLQSDMNYPTAIELSETGLLWTTLHFCCRFEAPKCLQYFLRKCYLQEPNQFIQFVNHQTNQGSSALHLCAIWDSPKCFALLVRCGGLNLNLKNKNHKTILNAAHDYQRSMMIKVIGSLERKYGKIVPWNCKSLEEPFCLDNIDIAWSERYTKMIDNLVEQSLVESKEQETKEEQSKQEIELRQIKQKLEQEKEELHLKRIQLQKEVQENESPVLASRKSNEDKSKTEAVDGPNGVESEGKKKVSKQELLIQRQLKQKEEQLQNVKRAIELLQYQTAYKLLRIEQNKMYERKDSQQQLQSNFIELKNHLLKMHAQKKAKVEQKLEDQSGQEAQCQIKINVETPRKQKSEKVGKEKAIDQIQTNKEELPLKSNRAQFLKSSYRKLEVHSSRKSLSDCLSPPEMSHFQELPKQIQKLYLQAVSDGKFQDKQFPHNVNSLGGLEHQAKVRAFVQSMVWLRPGSFLGKKYWLFDGIEPSDVKQGLLGVCYCLATISALAQDPSQIIKIFPFHDLQLGFYVLKFYSGGKPHFVVVDDYFPCNQSSQQPLFSKPIGQQVWVLLIEKAWAKLMGSYFAAESMTPDQFMEDLTGYPTSGALFKAKKDKIKHIVESSERGYPIVLTTGCRRMQSIISNHAYSLLKVHQIDQTKIYRMRNPWGRFMWNGRYGESSSLWTPELKAQCEMKDNSDVFFLSEAQVLQVFQYYSIAFDEKGYNYSFKEFSSKKEESLYFMIKHSGGKASFRVSQPFNRILRDSQYKYSPLLFEVGLMVGDKVKFVSQGSEKCFTGEKSVYASNDIFLDYEPGGYLIRIKMEWVNAEKYSQAVLSYFGKENVDIEAISAQKGQNLWRQMVLSFVEGKPLTVLNENVSFSMHWMRGQMICFASLSESSRVQTLRVRWQFIQAQLKNCRPAYNKTGDTCIEFTLNQKNRANFGTVERISIGKSCSSGSVSIQTPKI